MPNGATTSFDVNASTELQALEKKKDALKQVVLVAQAVERMQNSIQAVLLLNRPISSIPKRLLEFVTHLGETTRIMPTKKIQETIGQLDTTIANSLQCVMQLAQSGQLELRPDDAHTAETQAKISELLNGFRRKAQTAIALRVLLKERGFPSKPLHLLVDRGELERQLHVIEEKELAYRRRVEQELVVLQNDSKTIVDNESLPEEFRAAAANIVAMLQRNIDHVRCGKAIEDMPILLDVVEMQDTLDPDWINKSQSTPAPEVSAEMDCDARKKAGFFSKVLTWATTPLDVGWNDIKDRDS